FLGLVLKYKQYDIHTHLVGRFNAYNLLLIFAACVELGMDEQEALSQISKLKTAEGRFDTLRSNHNLIGIVDYAHTPDALKNVLDTINEIRTGNEKVICVVGCGGNRDKTKRPEMALIASQLSAKSIFTADNPRNEDADTIIDEMRKGVPPQNFNKVLAITNRKEAIRAAVSLANPNDIILVAGKGHEKYQEINGVKHPFDDKAI
ncbi:UDP-N-acetylmuramoyl-L-alanyl-D-glutamate--2,6-diaminopimelate ligase, partial [Candidatus Nomurabacteria bacterium]|nr:UDP-N-acetylmuramoyl-L-alanyl-D-glutamate--2,6-diaminopimelate ligase [Candidatus Nomurabacteria bacterium]